MWLRWLEGLEELVGLDGLGELVDLVELVELAGLVESSPRAKWSGSQHRSDALFSRWIQRLFVVSSEEMMK